MKAKFLTVEKRKTGKRFLLFLSFRAKVRGCCNVIPSEGPRDRSRGICFRQQTSRLPLEVTWRMAREAGPSAALRTTRKRSGRHKKSGCATVLRIRSHQKNETYCDFTDNPAWQPRAGHKDRLYLHLSLHNHCMRTSKSPSSPEKCSDIYA